MKHVAYIGSESREDGSGLRIFEVDDHTGAIVQIDAVEEARDPIYLAVSPDKRFLYAARRMPEGGAFSGGIAVYSMEGKRLAKTAEYPCSLTTPCHLSVSHDGRKLAYAEYRHGTAGLFDILADGSLAGPRSTVAHEGCGPDRERQESPHCHCAVFTPDDRYLCICDLGIDQVVVYDVSSGGMARADESVYKAAPGDGPRHMVFHPELSAAFLINELSNTITALSYHEGVFREMGRYPTLPKDFRLFSKAAAIKISPDGRYVLASNRGHDSIAVFRIQKDGSLERIAVNRLNGEFPRDFEFVPGGRFILLGHKMSDEVAVYEFDPPTGGMHLVGGVQRMPRPLCFVFGAPAGPA